jgi:hypothetical protein
LGLPYVDVTDDFSGDLSTESRANPLTYANEISGDENHNLSARVAPDGCIHFYLGHDSIGYGNLQIKCKCHPVEMKLNYGTEYEKVRYRNGYCRLDASRLTNIAKDVDNDDKLALNEIRTYTKMEIGSVHGFLKKLCGKLLKRNDVVTQC